MIQSRIAPAPISRGMSVRKLPRASYDEIEGVCNHYLAKTGGAYDGPASRAGFDALETTATTSQVDPPNAVDATAKHNLPSLNPAPELAARFFGRTPLRRRRHPVVVRGP